MRIAAGLLLIVVLAIGIAVIAGLLVGLFINVVNVVIQ